MGRRKDRQPGEVMNKGCPSGPRFHRSGCGRPDATTAQIIMVLSHDPSQTGRGVPAVFACSGKAAAQAGL